MIEDNFKLPMDEGGKLLEEGTYQVELFDVIVEPQPTYKTRMLPKEEWIMENTFKFHFVILDEEDRGRGLYRNFVPAYFYIGGKGKNVLMQIVESFLKRELTQEELHSFEADKLNKLINKQVIVGIKNNKVGEKTYSNIEVFYKAKQEVKGLTLEEIKDIKEKKEKSDIEREAKNFTPETVQESQTSEKDAQTVDPNSVKYPTNRADVPIIDVDKDNDDINLEDIPF